MNGKHEEGQFSRKEFSRKILLTWQERLRERETGGRENVSRNILVIFVCVVVTNTSVDGEREGGSGGGDFVSCFDCDFAAAFVSSNKGFTYLSFLVSGARICTRNFAREGRTLPPTVSINRRNRGIVT